MMKLDMKHYQREESVASDRRTHQVARRIIGGLLAGFALLPSASRGDDYPALRDNQVQSVVAVGDSLVAGNGRGEPGVTAGIYDDCLRNQHSFAYRVAEVLDANIKLVACSGASIDDIRNGRYGEPSQLDALDDSVDLVLLMAGANVVNITDLLGECEGMKCGAGRAMYDAAISDLRSEEFHAELSSLYVAIAERAPNAVVAVIGYPRIISNDHLWLTQYVVDESLQRRIIAFVDELNLAIASSVLQAQAQGARVALIEPTDDMEIVNGLGKTFFLPGNGVDSRAVGHPTKEGYQILARTVLKSLPEVLAYQPVKSSLALSADAVSPGDN